MEPISVMDEAAAEAPAQTISAWSDLPPDLLGKISNGLFLPYKIDRARFRAVCRSWHSAVRHHGPPPARQLPWILRPTGKLVDPNGGDSPRFASFPDDDDTVCVGATDGWLAFVRLTDNDEKTRRRRHSYSLYNPFSGRTVPLPELDTVIGYVSDLFEVRKVLVRSSTHPAATDDLVVVFMTNNWNHPVILIRPGKGLWLPKPRTAPFTRIVNVAFLDDDRLYGITEAEDLFALRIDNDVIGFERVIRSFHGYAWMSDDDDDNKDENNNNGDHYDEDANDNDGQVDVVDEHELTTEKLRMKTGDGKIRYEGLRIVHEDDDGFITMEWYLVESRGKLVLVKRRVTWPNWKSKFTLHVDVLEADLSITGGGATWVSMLGGGLGLDGEALFISKFSSKSVTAYGDMVHEDDIFFVDTGEVFNVRSQTISPQIWGYDIYRVMWVFVPELVV